MRMSPALFDFSGGPVAIFISISEALSRRQLVLLIPLKRFLTYTGSSGVQLVSRPVVVVGFYGGQLPQRLDVDGTRLVRPTFRLFSHRSVRHLAVLSNVVPNGLVHSGPRHIMHIQGGSRYTPPHHKKGLRSTLISL